MSTALLSPQEIVANLRDSGVIDAGTARRLEIRIIEYGESRSGDGRKEGIEACARRAAAAAAAVRGGSQRTGAQKVLRAVERLLPFGGETQQEAYSRGFKDGLQNQPKRHKPDTR